MSVPEPHVSELSSAPARSRAETRRRLVEAGTELFAARGLHGATSASIARRAGVATGTFYLHFRDKESLLREIVFGALAQLRARQDGASERVGPGSGRELRARTDELLRFAEENQDLIRVVFGPGATGAPFGEEILDAIVPDVERRLEARVAAGLAPADLHPGVAAQALAALTVRVMCWWIDHPEKATRDQVTDTILRMHPGAPGRAAGA